MMSARLLPRLIIVSLMILSAQNFAKAQGRFRPPVFDRDRPSYDFNSRPIVLRLYRDFRGRSEIDLSQLLRDRNVRARGMSLESVTMLASSARGRAKAQLEINGLSQPADRQTIPTYSRPIDFRVDRDRNVIGRHINSLKIQMRGNVHVESVEIVLSDNGRGRGRNEVFTQQVSDFINFGKTYRMRQKLGVGPRHNGKKVKFVEITGASPSGNASAQLLIEGRPVGRVQYFSRFQNTLRFQMPYNQDVLGQDIKGLQIQVNGGGVHVTELKMAVQSRRGGGPGRNPQVVERNVDLHVTGRQEHSLEDLISRRDLSHFRVKSVEITGRSRGGNGRVQICQKNNWGGADCQRAQVLDRAQTRHSFFSGDNLNEIELRTVGQIHIQKIVVRFERR